MKPGLQAYADCVEVLNNHKLSSAEIQQIAMMLVHQLPDALPDNQQYFKQFIYKTLTKDGVELPLLKLNGTPNIHTGDVVTWSQSKPKNDDEVIDIAVTAVTDRSFKLDQYNTQLICKFHSQHLPDRKLFDELEDDSIGMTMVYAHINGAFTVEFHREGGSTLHLQGEFLRTSFIPVKLVDKTN